MRHPRGRGVSARGAAPDHLNGGGAGILGEEIPARTLPHLPRRRLFDVGEGVSQDAELAAPVPGN